MYIKTIDYKSAHAMLDFSSSLRETGFSVLTNHPISPDLMEAVYHDWQSFFKSKSKFDYLFSPNKIRQSGYFPFKSENAKGYVAKDLKEFYHYYNEADLPKGMARNTQFLFEELSKLGQELLHWVEKALPTDLASSLSMPLHEMIQGSNMTLIRILHYPPILHNEEEGAVRAAAHEDIDLLTILPAATTPGLQVLDSQGRWHDVSCDYGTLIFNAGDMLQMTTKGYYKSTTHRVINPVGDAARKARYSLPLFLHPRNEVRLSETHTAGSYLAERLAELGLNQAA